MTDRALGDLKRTRSSEQQAAYAQTVGSGSCPFCGPTSQMPSEIQERMVLEGVHWRAWHNPFPYSGHREHLILAPIEHWTQPSDLSPAAMLEWMEMNIRLIAQFELPGGGLVMRFGDHEYKGGSITHLHSHIQVPDCRSFAIAVFFADDELKRFFAQNH